MLLMRLGHKRLPSLSRTKKGNGDAERPAVFISPLVIGILSPEEEADEMRWRRSGSRSRRKHSELWVAAEQLDGGTGVCQSGDPRESCKSVGRGDLKRPPTSQLPSLYSLNASLEAGLPSDSEQTGLRNSNLPNRSAWK